MGATRPARRAGIHADTTVTATPMANDNSMAIGSTVSGPAGSARPNPPSSAFRPIATPIPAATPAAEATTPMTTDSPTAERTTWPRLAPSARSIAICRERWATVIEKVLLMMKAPTNIATNANTSMKMPNAPKDSSKAFSASATSSSPVMTSTPSGKAVEMREESSR